MTLFRGMCRPDPKYSAVSVRKVECARLGYRTRLSRLHVSNPPLAIAFPRGDHLTTPDPEPLDMW
jgi:hypothetical protein